MGLIVSFSSFDDVDQIFISILSLVLKILLRNVDAPSYGYQIALNLYFLLIILNYQGVCRIFRLRYQDLSLSVIYVAISGLGTRLLSYFSCVII